MRLPVGDGAFIGGVGAARLSISTKPKQVSDATYWVGKVLEPGAALSAVLARHVKRRVRCTW